VLLFPQGEIKSVYTQKIKFEKGLERILKDNSGKIQVLFLANLIDYFSEEKPTLYMYYREFAAHEPSMEEVENEFNQFYSGCITENLNKSDNQ
jgi:hypothetical protein